MLNHLLLALFLIRAVPVLPFCHKENNMGTLYIVYFSRKAAGGDLDQKKNVHLALY